MYVLTKLTPLSRQAEEKPKKSKAPEAPWFDLIGLGGTTSCGSSACNALCSNSLAIATSRDLYNRVCSFGGSPCIFRTNIPILLESEYFTVLLLGFPPSIYRVIIGSPETFFRSSKVPRILANSEAPGHWRRVWGRGN